MVVADVFEHGVGDDHVEGFRRQPAILGVADLDLDVYPVLPCTCTSKLGKL